jgi:AcrR family transcriptional regulator
MVATQSGRPRDAQIDEAVLRATSELLERDGYLQLTIANIAARAGTSKPAIYRRWPTKAHLVHEAVFPAQQFGSIRSGGDLRADIRTLVRRGMELLGRPAARAALPGLLAESAANGSLAAEVLAQAAGDTFAWLETRLAAGVASGEVRAGVKAATVFELVAGAAFIATVSARPDATDKRWLDAVVDVIVRGLAP